MRGPRTCPQNVAKRCTAVHSTVLLRMPSCKPCLGPAVAGDDYQLLNCYNGTTIVTITSQPPHSRHNGTTTSQPPHSRHTLKPHTEVTPTTPAQHTHNSGISSSSSQPTNCSSPSPSLSTSLPFVNTYTRSRARDADSLLRRLL